MAVIALVATIPRRKRSVERLLIELAKQSRSPHSVILVLDGYGDEPSPKCPLPVLCEYRHSVYEGAGSRWKAAGLVDSQDILVTVDDDAVIGSDFVKALSECVEHRGGASAAMGKIFFDGTRAPPGDYAMGQLVHGAGCGLTARGKDLAGLSAFGQKIFAEGGPDFLGYCGDDDALASAFLWKSGVPVHHAATGNVTWAPGTQAPHERITRADRVADPDAQKRWLVKHLGWPWTPDKLLFQVGARP